jgi:hypothetical protein
MGEPRERVDELRRSAYAKRVLPAWLQKLRVATGIKLTPDHFLSHAETISLKALFYETLARLPQSAKRNWPIADRDKLALQLAGLCSSAPNTEVIVFHSDDEQLGAFRLRADVALQFPFELWKVLGEDLRLLTTDCDSGLCLGVEQYSLHGDFCAQEIYEYAGWGCLRLAARTDSSSEPRVGGQNPG